MLEWKILNSMSLSKYCKGSIVAARIYADVPGNKCQCGGVFSKRVPHPDEEKILVPKCDKCEKYPPLFHIDADARDINGGKIRVKIRNDQNNTRLDKISKVMFTLEKIQQEISEGSFDIRRYDSAISKEAYIFKNYVVEYLAHQERRLLRDEIKPKGLHDKKGLIRRELLPFFGNVELGRINPAMINKFRDSYTTKLRTRDLALGELKALLNQAHRDGMVVMAPKFEPIPRSKTRDEIIPKELAIKTIQAMPKEIYRDMYTLMLIYPMRPSELRALMWKHIDFQKGEITICQHFSSEVLVDGRKSIKKGKKESSIKFPMTPLAREILSRYRSAQLVSLSSYVFLSRFGRHFAGATLWDVWKFARDRVGHTYAPYECRHVSASDLYEKTNGDLIKMKKVGGWTNTATLERYVHDRSDARELF